MAEDENRDDNVPLGTNEAGEPISIRIVAQYTKDLSFENPNAPRSLQQGGQPKIDVNVNVAANKQQEDVYEVLLKLDAKATTNEGRDVAFVVDLTYGGLFALKNVPQQHLELFLIVEAPRLLFPFARRVFGDATRDGGFPPLMLDPIDFAQLYMARQAQRQQQGDQGGDGQDGETPNIILPS